MENKKEKQTTQNEVWIERKIIHSNHLHPPPSNSINSKLNDLLMFPQCVEWKISDNSILSIPFPSPYINKPKENSRKGYKYSSIGEKKTWKEMEEQKKNVQLLFGVFYSVWPRHSWVSYWWNKGAIAIHLNCYLKTQNNT